MAKQTVFGWFEAGLNRAGVVSLCPFRPEIIHESGRVTGGQFDGAGYRTWLRWMAPLSHDGNDGLRLVSAQAINLGVAS